jgi:para-aminobenzoate synthetase component 1
MLHGKWGLSSVQTLIGINHKSKITNHKYKIGYFAYPNPTLKNSIPCSRFYECDSLITGSISVAPISYRTFGKLEQSVTKNEYIKKILKIKELLAAGEIYQLDYAIRFRKKFEGEPFALFLKLIEINPSDFSAYLNCGSFQIISNSPERLFKVENGVIMTQPIKGTIRKDSGLRTQKSARIQLSPESCVLSPEVVKLLNSEKERAELDMITDLERNDIGKICEYGTLKLTKEREILEMKNLWHAYSEVRGKLRPNIGFKEIIDAMFPGGSVTGCPKKRAMEYIELLEDMPRNIFTGSIGYVSNGGSALRALTSPSGVDQPFGRGLNNIIPREAGSRRSLANAKSAEVQRRQTKLAHNMEMDFNIGIRTALVKDGWIEYWAGGGIVADSDPEKEYEECLLKAERFLGII